MIPPKCFTCGKMLCDIDIEYRRNKTLWLNDENLTNKDVNKKISKLLTDLHITRQCCTSQVLTSIELIKIII